MSTPAEARAQAKYARTPKGKAAIARAAAKHRRTPKGKASSARAVARYQQTPNGKAARARVEATPERILYKSLYGLRRTMKSRREQIALLEEELKNAIQ